MELCPYCGDVASFDVAEILLDTREVLLDACCEENLAGWIESIRQFTDESAQGGCLRRLASRSRTSL